MDKERATIFMTEEALSAARIALCASQNGPNQPIAARPVDSEKKDHNAKADPKAKLASKRPLEPSAAWIVCHNSGMLCSGAGPGLQPVAGTPPSGSPRADISVGGGGGGGDHGYWTSC
jgi:hypothetical protein